MANPHGVILVGASALTPRLARPPQLMPVANRPLVDHAIAALCDAGVASTTIVGDRETLSCVGELLVGSTGSQGTVGMLEVPFGYGTLDTLRAARAAIGNAPLVVHRGDSLVGGALTRELRRFVAGAADAVILVASREPNGSEGRTGTIETALPLGIEILSESLLEALDAVTTDASGELESVIALAEKELAFTVEERVVPRGWRFTGTAADVLVGNRVALDELESSWHPDSLERTRIEGPIVIHPSSHVEDTFLRGPCLIGANTVVRHAYIGPHTTIGTDCEIENVEIAHSVVMHGATIRDVGWRLEQSVVGARARVHRDFRFPKAVQLYLGDDARILVS